MNLSCSPIWGSTLISRWRASPCSVCVLSYVTGYPCLTSSKCLSSSPVHLLAQDRLRVPPYHVLARKAEELREDLVGEAATKVLVPRDGHGGNVVGEKAQLLLVVAQGLFRLLADRDIRADSAVTRKPPLGVEERIRADRQMQLAAVERAARELEVANRYVRVERCAVRLPAGLVRGRGRHLPSPLADLRALAEHRQCVQLLGGETVVGEPVVGIAFPSRSPRTSQSGRGSSPRSRASGAAAR